MNRPKQIAEYAPDGATPLTPLQLNEMRFDVRHTVLTPELLASLPGADRRAGASAAAKTESAASGKN